MKTKMNRIRGKVNLSNWDLPESLDLKFDDELLALSEDLKNLIEKRLDYDLNAKSIKNAASEALTYSIKYKADIDFCRTKNPSVVTVGFPLGNQEFDFVCWDINLYDAIKAFASIDVRDAVFSDEAKRRYKGLISTLRKSADWLEKEYERAEKEKKSS